MKKPIKAARVLADLTQQELCEMAGVPLITLRRLEGRPSHKGLVSAESEAAVVNALEGAGVDFIPENGGGHGVRLRNRFDLGEHRSGGGA